MAAALVAGCSSSTQPERATDGTPRAPATTPATAPADVPSPPQAPADLAQQLAIEAYRSMWEDYAVAAETADWDSPRLADHATGDALDVISRGLYASHYNGVVAKGRPVLNPEVTSAEPPEDPATVVIADCGDASTWVQYDAETGELVDDEPDGHRLIAAEVQKQPDGSWKVTGFGIQEAGSC